MAPNLITAVDIGSDAVKVVSLRNRGGALEVLGAGFAPVHDLDRNDPDYVDEMAAALNRVVKRNNIRPGHTVVGLPGRGSMTRYLTVPVVPPWKLQLVMGFEVEEQMGAAGGKDRVAFDYRILRLPFPDDSQFPMFLALAQLSVIDERLQICRQGLGRVDDVGLQGLGAFNLFRRSPQCSDEEVSLLLDIGAEETQLTLQRGEDLYFARTISSGGKNFTQRLQRTLGLLGPEAEDWKREQARILPHSEENLYAAETLEASQACRAEAGAIANQVQSSLQFFGKQFGLPGIRPEALYVTGGGSRLAGLPEALGETLRLPAARFDPADTVQPKGDAAVAAFTGENAQIFSAAAGLAASYVTNGFAVSLLPPAVKEKREFWSRKIYAYYSGALALMLLVLVALSYRRPAAYKAERNQLWQQQVDAAKGLHKNLAKAKQTNEQLAAKLDALQVREASGHDLLRSLQELAAHTPPDVIYTRFETAGEIEDDLRAGGAAPAGKKTRAPSESFQKKRHILLHGYVVSAPDERKARDRLRTLADTLEALPFFHEVQTLRQEPLPNDDPQVAAAGAVRLLGAKGALDATPVVKPRKDRVALRFSLRCGIRK